MLSSRPDVTVQHLAHYSLHDIATAFCSKWLHPLYTKSGSFHLSLSGLTTQENLCLFSLPAKPFWKEKHSPWWWCSNRKGYGACTTVASDGVKGSYQVQFLWQVAPIWNSSVEINTLFYLQLNQCCWVRKQIPLYHSLSWTLFSILISSHSGKIEG